MDVSIAHVLQGEAGLCGAEAMLIIAWMLYRGAGPWYGNQEPGLTAQIVARYWWTVPDPLPSAWYCFSAQDLQQARVRAIIGKRKPLARYRCAGGLSLTFY